MPVQKKRLETTYHTVQLWSTRLSSYLSRYRLGWWNTRLHSGIKPLPNDATSWSWAVTWNNSEQNPGGWAVCKSVRKMVTCMATVHFGPCCVRRIVGEARSDLSACTNTIVPTVFFKLILQQTSTHGYYFTHSWRKIFEIFTTVYTFVWLVGKFMYNHRAKSKCHRVGVNLCYVNIAVF